MKWAPAAVVAAATALALFSVLHSGGHVWRRIADDHRSFAAYTRLERYRAAASGVAIDGAILDWYAQFVSKGDRVYVQADPERNGRLMQLLVGYYLLPAAEVDDPSKATVVISYFADPNALGLHYLTQQESGLQPIYVSRISAP